MDTCCHSAGQYVNLILVVKSRRCSVIGIAIIYVHACVRMHVCMYVCVRVHVCMYVHVGHNKNLRPDSFNCGLS